MLETTITELALRHEASRDFVKAILSAQNLVELAEQSSGADEFCTRAGDAWKYVFYAFCTNQRAENSLQKMLALAQPDRTGVALDVGCGYGGFLNAFGKKGFKAHGVEINNHLVELAKLNLKDATFEHEIFAGDVFADGPLLGKYDLITVNDVIEHLNDPIFAFNRMASMLNPGGVLAIYAPNGQSIFNVIADPHNRVCGSASMPGPLARTYVQSALNSSGYSLGEYFTLEIFQDLAARNDLEFRFKPHDGGERPEKAREYLKKLMDTFVAADFYQKCSPILARDVEANIWRYIAEYAAQAIEGTSGKSYCAFNNKYLARAWTITCKKMK